MAFTVEDGSGIVGANSYMTVAEADTYWADRKNGADWQSATEKEGALVEASAYLDAAYNWVWLNPPGGQSSLSPLEANTPLKNPNQGLEWPRNAAYNEDTFLLISGVPQRVKDATAELALQALSGALLGALDRGGLVKRERVGPLEVEYMPSAPGNKTYPFVDWLLRGLYFKRGGDRKLMRA